MNQLPPKAPSAVHWLLVFLLLSSVLVSVYGGMVAQLLSVFVLGGAIYGAYVVGRWAFLSVRHRYFGRFPV